MASRSLSHFNLLQRAVGKGGGRRAIMLAVFDLPLLNGEDLRDRPLTERRERLQNLLGSPYPDGVVFSEAIEGNPGDLQTQACEFVSRASSQSGSTAPIAPVGAKNGQSQCINTDEFIVIGYEPGGSYGGLASLLLATPKNGKLVYVGGVGTGFNGCSAAPLKARLDELTTAKPAIPGLRNKQAVWTKPQTVAEVEISWLHRGRATAPPVIQAPPRRQIDKRIPLRNHFADTSVFFGENV